MREFRDIGAFLRHMAGAELRAEVAGPVGIERAARLIKAEAVREIGHYQETVGDFAAWPELKDGTKDDRVRQGFSENEPGYRSGEMQNSIGYEVGGVEGVVGSNDPHMEWFDQGTDRQMPRSVFGGAAMRKQAAAIDAMAAAIVASLAGISATALLAAHGAPHEEEPE